MKPPVRLVVTIAVALLAGGLVVRFQRSRADAAEARLERALLEREFLERSSVARQLPAARQREWVEEARGLVRWYFDGLAAIQARHPGASADGSREKGKAGKEQAAARAEWGRYVDDRFTSLRAGRYDPLYSASDQGLHLDLLSFAPAEGPGGERALRIDFALWGAPRQIDRETPPGASRTTSRVTVPVAFKQLSFSFVDAAGKPYGEMSGSGEPYQKVADPERFVADFPPGILLGTWHVDPFPREAERVEVSVALEAHAPAGAAVAASYRWELPVREEWKLRPGETFKAEAREAPAR